jgi:carbon dioxide concentrating mechanism protein CcmN
MYLPPLQTLSEGLQTRAAPAHVSGDVSIHPNAAIAPGVILQAAPNSRIVVAAGACIGMGAIIEAHEGTIEIQQGAVLGAGVLAIGRGTIGEYACVGAATTIWNTSVAAMEAIAAGSILGDRSRSVDLSDDAVPEKASSTASSPTSNSDESCDRTPSPSPPSSAADVTQASGYHHTDNGTTPSGAAPPADRNGYPDSSPAQAGATTPPTEFHGNSNGGVRAAHGQPDFASPFPDASFSASESKNGQTAENQAGSSLDGVATSQSQNGGTSGAATGASMSPHMPSPNYGQAYIHQLLVTLFPHRHPSNYTPASNNDSHTESEDDAGTAENF